MLLSFSPACWLSRIHYFLSCRVSHTHCDCCRHANVCASRVFSSLLTDWSSENNASRSGMQVSCQLRDRKSSSTALSLSLLFPLLSATHHKKKKREWEMAALEARGEANWKKEKNVATVTASFFNASSMINCFSFLSLSLFFTASSSSRYRKFTTAAAAHTDSSSLWLWLLYSPAATCRLKD